MSFDHISPKLQLEEVNKPSKRMYEYYNEIYTFYRGKYKHLKKASLKLYLMSVGLTPLGDSFGAIYTLFFSDPVSSWYAGSGLPYEERYQKKLRRVGLPIGAIRRV